MVVEVGVEIEEVCFDAELGVWILEGGTVANVDNGAVAGWLM